MRIYAFHSFHLTRGNNVTATATATASAVVDAADADVKVKRTNSDAKQGII